MKKLSLAALMIAGLALSACNSNTAKTGNAVADSGSHGSSGAIDTAAKGSPMGTSASGTMPSSGSDTSTTGH
ncbi:hypothetical protein [Mucilaginibacter sp.]|uniref:hypothetical protein n=1 Tax=Mucilaginibacter sp. TaxID=1882438 RepID=UPI003AFF7F67